MSKEIKEFVEKLKDWRKNFKTEDYDYTKYNCEISHIAKWQKENNLNALIEFWNEKCKEDFFELKHPLYNDVITRAVYSCNNSIFNNWVFFTDKEHKHPFWLGQTCNLVNVIIEQNGIYKINIGWGEAMIFGSINNSLRKHIIQEPKMINDLFFKDIKFGFTFENYRPAHFFCQILNHFIQIKHNKAVFSENSYFTPKNSLITKDKNLVYFYPTAFMNANLPQTYSFVRTDSLQDYSTLTDKEPLKQDYDLTIWLGLPGERRAWLEQITGTAQILKNFSKYFKKIKVYVDGMTAYDGQRGDYPENKVLFNKVVKSTKELFNKEIKPSNNENFKQELLSLWGGGLINLS